MHSTAHSVARRLAATGALFLCTAGSLHAQGTTGSIRGRVTESVSGRPIPDATVTLAGRTQGAVTSANGDYFIPNVAAGTASVTARRIGYGRSTRSVDVTAGAEARADFTLAVTAS